MDNYKKARNTFIALRAIFVSVLVAVIAGFILWGAYKMYIKADLSRQQARQAQNEYKELNEREDLLSKKLDELDTPIGKEKWLREAYNVGKEGEKVMVIVDPNEGKEEEGENERGGWLGSIFGIVSSWF